jgi:hypothetical protein
MEMVLGIGHQAIKNVVPYTATCPSNKYVLRHNKNGKFPREPLSIRSPSICKASALVFGLIFLGHPLATHAQLTSTPKSTPTTTNYSELVTRVWQTVLVQYYDPRFRGVDWQSYQKGYARHSYAKPEQAYQAAQELLSKLQDRYLEKTLIIGVYSPISSFLMVLEKTKTLL